MGFLFSLCCVPFALTCHSYLTSHRQIFTINHFSSTPVLVNIIMRNTSIQGRRQDFQKGGSALSIESPQRGSGAVYTCTRVNMCILINSFAIASRGT